MKNINRKQVILSAVLSSLLLGQVSLLAKATDIKTSSNLDVKSISIKDAQKFKTKEGKYISQKQYFQILREDKLKEINSLVTDSVKQDARHEKSKNSLIGLKNKEKAAVEVAIENEKDSERKRFKALMKKLDASKSKQLKGIEKFYASKLQKVDEQKVLSQLDVDKKSLSLKKELEKINAMEKLAVKQSKLKKQGVHLTADGSIKLNGVGNVITYIDKNKTLNGVLLSTGLLDTLKIYKYCLENSWSYSIEKRIITYMLNVASKNKAIDYGLFKEMIENRDIYEIKQNIKALEQEILKNSLKNNQGLK